MRKHKRNIEVNVSSIDGYDKTKSFTRLGPAQKFAHAAIGAHPDMGSWYAVDETFGTTKVMVTGATLAELFPEAQHVSESTECYCDGLQQYVSEMRMEDYSGDFRAPLTFDPLTGNYEVICGYCASPKGVAQRRRYMKQQAKRQPRVEKQQRRRRIKRAYADPIPF